MNDPNTCMTCGKQRITKDDEKGEVIHWTAVFAIFLQPEAIAAIYTVCPGCRDNHSLKSIMQKVTEVTLAEAKAEYAKA